MVSERIDTRRLNADHPIEEVVASYGVALHRSGRSLLGRCPFHDDRGRPNLYAYPASGRWRCYRCGAGGDAIAFVALAEGLGFRDACARLAGRPAPPGHRSRRRRAALARSDAATRPGPAELACLAAAVDLYHNSLLGEPDALAYLAARGVDRSTAAACRIGYAAGDQLAAYLGWRGLPPGAARRVGLLGRGGRELQAGRIVVPELRAGRPVWLIGRAFRPPDAEPRYLGLPAPKPLLGWEAVSGSPVVWLSEGPFDYLLLRAWGLPAVALLGTCPRPDAVAALARFDRVYVTLDEDPAGRAATGALVRALGDRAVAVPLPGVGDVGELAAVPGGRAALLRSAARAARARAA